MSTTQIHTETRTDDDLIVDVCRLIDDHYPTTPVQKECIRAIYAFLGSFERLVFLTINIDQRSLDRAMRKFNATLSSEFRKNSDGKAPANRYRTLFQKFLYHINTPLLGKHRAKLGQQIQYFCVLENDGYRYKKNADALHAHILVGLPDRVSYEDFERRTREYWAKYIDQHSAQLRLCDTARQPLSFEQLKEKSTKSPSEMKVKGDVLNFQPLPNLDARLIQYCVKQLSDGSKYHERAFSSLDTAAKRYAA
jgi:hypothetical protein